MRVCGFSFALEPVSLLSKPKSVHFDPEGVFFGWMKVALQGFTTPSFLLSFEVFKDALLVGCAENKESLVGFCKNFVVEETKARFQEEDFSIVLLKVLEGST